MVIKHFLVSDHAEQETYKEKYLPIRTFNIGFI
jgi:hypothetical protein